jgi:hypothetical protein
MSDEMIIDILRAARRSIKTGQSYVIAGSFLLFGLLLLAVFFFLVITGQA